jgi:hypothetical protein
MLTQNFEKEARLKKPGKYVRNNKEQGGGKEKGRWRKYKESEQKRVRKETEQVGKERKNNTKRNKNTYRKE